MNDVFLDEIVRAGEPDPHAQRTRRSNRAERERRRRRRRRRRRALLATVLTLALLGGAGYGVWRYALPRLGGLNHGSSNDYPGPGQGQVMVLIPEGSSGAAMGAVLADAGVVRTAGAFAAAFKKDSQATAIQPGTYRLMYKMRAADVVTALLDPNNRVQTKVTIPEGLRLSDILEKLSSVTAVPVADFEAALKDPKAIGLPDEADGQAEGWLFPATYTFEPGTEPTEMLAQMVAKTISVLDAGGVEPADRERILNIASLIEREARLDEDRPKVARAIYNRLDVNMLLEIDSSVAYGLNKSGVDLTRADLDDSKNPYNTRQHLGLPPTPICSPGQKSIDAALEPADGPWKFWVTINFDTGETRFAVTVPEHEANVALLRKWQAEHSTAGEDGK